VKKGDRDEPATLELWNRLTDEQVIARLLAGQSGLFEVLMRRHAERLYRAARAITRDDRVAEDVVLQGFLNAYARLPEFNDTNPFGTWLTRAAIAESLARVRRQDLDPPLAAAVAAPPEGPQ
jgi:RNA polymerase sigma-70 factor, ECF subfamily